MDVGKKLVSFFLALVFLAACDPKNNASGGSRFIKSANPGCESQRIPGEYLVMWQDGRITVEHYNSESEFIENFMEQNGEQVLTAEPHYRVELIESVGVQTRDWGGEMNWGVETVEAESVWNKSSPSAEVIVAVIDSGLDITHPELQGTLAINSAEVINGLDDDGNGLIDDISGYDFVADSGDVVDYTGHGTHVSGVIVARHDTGKILGVAPQVKLLPLGFISRGGGGQVEGAIRAIRYAADQGARVINASWGGESCSLPLRDEIGALAARNILFVTAAGNSGNDLDISPEFPAAFLLDNMLTVGASTFDRKMPEFSNYGLLVDIVAPGANIMSTFPREEDDKDGKKDGLVALNGTSMAAPYVAGAAALLWSKKPSASYAEIKAALLAGVESGPFHVQTRGELNIRKALEALNP